MKCGVQYAATDFITPDVVATSVFTWAAGQPSPELRADSCVWIKYGLDESMALNSPQMAAWLYVANTCTPLNRPKMAACMVTHHPLKN